MSYFGTSLKVTPTVKVGAVTGVQEKAAGGGGGGLEGAERTMRETVAWTPAMGSPDQLINRAKPLADARGRDMSLNEGFGHGAVQTHKDSIVGAHYRLNAVPTIKVLETYSKSFDETWLNEYREVVEERFDLLAESDANWLDARRSMSLTAMIRLVIGGFCTGGEGLATAEWLSKDRSRPLATAIQLVSPTRLCNPDGAPDDRYLKRGVKKDFRGRPIGYWFRNTRPYDYTDMETLSWTYVPAEKPWGRKQVLHIFEPFEIDQTRGIADMVAALKDMRMTKTFKETTLQNAVINASYAAALESELPPEVVYGMMGGGNGGENYTMALGAYLSMVQDFFGGSNNVMLDGAKIPVLPPGMKMNARSLGTPGGIGTNFEDSLHRNVAAALGLSFEEYTRNWQGVSYSGGKMAVSQTGRFMKTRKKVVADRVANFAYALVLEEEIANGNIPLPRGIGRNAFYDPLMKDALCRAEWIGAGAGQIDELKETQAAILRIKSGLSTYEREIARLGDADWRRTFAQIAREQGVVKDLGIVLTTDTQKDGNKDPQNTLADNNQQGSAAK